MPLDAKLISDFELHRRRLVLHLFGLVCAIVMIAGAVMGTGSRPLDILVGCSATLVFLRAAPKCAEDYGAMSTATR